MRIEILYSIKPRQVAMLILERLPEELESRLGAKRGSCRIITGDHVHFQVQLVPAYAEHPHQIQIEIGDGKIMVELISRAGIPLPFQEMIRVIIREIAGPFLSPRVVASA